MFILRIIMGILRGIIGLFQLLLVIRAIMSWIMPYEQNRFTYLVHTLTEPILRPVRLFLRRFPALNRFPIDFSALAALLILMLAERILSVLTFWI